MKKILTILTILSVATLVSCSSGEKTEEKATADSTATATVDTAVVCCADSTKTLTEADSSATK